MRKTKPPHILNMRELLRLGVAIYFENKNIDTGKMTSEQPADIYGAFAQMETTSHPQNMRVSYRIQMEKGIFVPAKAFGITLSQFFSEDGETMVLDAEQSLLLERWARLSNLHPAIIDRGTFRKVQEEIARRVGKKKTSARAKTEFGKYSGKYALSEFLVCGECGSPYRRQTYNGARNTTYGVA